MDAWAKPAGNLVGSCSDRALRTGVAALAVGLIVAVALVKADVPGLYRLVLFLPFFVATDGLAKGLYKT